MPDAGAGVMKTYSTLLQEQTGPVRKITTNRPEVLNAQSRILLEELDDAFLRAVDDDSVRVVILAGAGKHFSAGHDLGSPQEMEDQKKTPLEPGFRGEYRRLYERFFENTMRWRDLPKPTIAQVQGYCIMGGMMIASACDLIIASEDAQFADRAVKWGGGHVQYFAMPWDLGPRKAKEYLFTGAFIAAAEAERLGLVNRVVPRERLEQETMKLAQEIAERDPFALKFAKASVNEMQNAQGWREAMEGAFKNYMLTIPHRMELGTYGPAARKKAPKDRFGVLNKKV
ncbi:MAG: enoyl-CoA hydratase [Alphaproteobacteria bacterium]|nr:enoyl-CoA hydratase [Alphaproteobacteria bacterium]